MLLIAFLGGVLTLLSPCILPVLPLLLSRAGGPAWAPALTLAGLASGFAVLASLATLSSAWVEGASQAGRYLALVLLTLSSLALLSSRIGTWLSRPWLWLGERLQVRAGGLPPALSAWLLGCAAGLLWAPCAGPILGLILSGAMLEGPSASTSLSLLAFGLGNAVALGAVIFLGRGLVRRLRPSLPALAWLRRGAGTLALLAVVVIATGNGAQLASLGSSRLASALERAVLEGVPRLLEPLVASAQAETSGRLPELGAMPSLDGATQWLNGPSLDVEGLRGKVVLVDFWTYDCINCRNSLPHVNQWARKYRDQGLVVIGVHTPEYPYERILENVQAAMRRLDVHHPVAIDNQYRIWNAFSNRYWPAHYFIDARGQVRHLHVGEGDYAEQEAVIRALLKERADQGLDGS
ncbi:cytochrome c biogenesis protein DipZ [Metapseudomonas furukawaii]|jgi:cytochrome c biogenesis protein CcdA/thiol-disulfide isomerase/thioredoxin|uniref:cytochrome c biogenesis protein DipZ n=1 Tax=Metapseudomonas furukawaii TaxID=1149133 RepID=UPI00227C27CC|nr:cytochrome c biogenesis protein DipZ [Pseudomonas furukawaii]WAG76691.1 cytochrome c biogenesis protein DipZ [Pseudomonas furukawaii]